jgi:hypothetical protein
MIITTIALILFVILVGVTLIGGRLRRFHNLGTRLPICRHCPNSQRPDDKHVARSRQGQPLSGRVKRPILLVAS